MKLLGIAALMLALTAAAYAEYTSPAVDFFMHDRFYDTFLRDHFRFEEPSPFRIEYYYTSWLDSSDLADEYRDYMYFEGSFPAYHGDRLMVDIPFHYSRLPLWAESGESSYGGSMNAIKPSLMTRWVINDGFRAIVGGEYNLKGDGDKFGNISGREICLLKAYLSYDLNRKVNFVGGVRLDRYYYDTNEEADVYKISDRLYYHPAAMMNWHPSDNFILLLGIPSSGIHFALGNILKAEVRAALDRKIEIGIRLEPIERNSVVLRYFNNPYTEVPIKGESFGESDPLAERLCYTDKGVFLEVCHQLNPAAVASLGFRYSPGGSMELKDNASENVVKKLDVKPSFALGFVFTVDLEALAGRQ